jgi:preprotein translocase subunit SecA
MVGIQFNNNKLFSNKTNSIPRQYQQLVNDINELEKDLKNLTDVELRTESFKLQNEYKEKQDLNDA